MARPAPSRPLGGAWGAMGTRAAGRADAPRPGFWPEHPARAGALGRRPGETLLAQPCRRYRWRISREFEVVQLRQVGENLRAALEAAGAPLDHLVKTTTYVTDIEEYFRHVDVRMEYFRALPTSTTVEVRRLAHPDFLVEVEAIAVVD